LSRSSVPPTDNNVSVSQSTDWGYTSYSQFSRRSDSQRTDSDNQSMIIRQVNREISPDSTRVSDRPPPSVWDNMGILGLSAKIYSDNTYKERFTSYSYLRKESVTSHVI